MKVPRTLGPLTMRRIHNTLSGALKSAVRAGLMTSNPAPDAELPKAVQPKVKIWTAEQLGAFLDATEKERLCPLYHLAALAGMRRGELCGISWDDVDLDKGRITVRWQITDQNYRNARAAEKQGKPARYRTKPKTRAGEDRIVDLDAVSTEVLRAWREEQAKEREQWGPAYQDPSDENGMPFNLVFTREDGASLDPGRTTLEFVRLVRVAGLSHLKLHGLRYINISLPARSGRLRVGHRDADRSHVPSAHPVDLRPHHRYRRPTSSRGHRSTGPSGSSSRRARQDPQQFRNKTAPNNYRARWH